MKKIIYYMLCLASVIACTQTEKNKVSIIKEKGPAQYALSLDSAIVYAKRYDSIASARLKGTVPIKSYTIRATDLLEAMGMTKSDTIVYGNIRVYLGIDLNNKFRLLMTPVADADIDHGNAGSDVILSGKYTSDLMSAGAVVSVGSYVLDFTGPCPTSCPTKSILNPNE